jgi:excisionase family DNA binding protein
MMATETLRATQAARRLGIPTKEVIRLALENKIRFVMVDGMVHFPEDALDEYQAKAS